MECPPPGWLKETFMVFLLSNLWLPDGGGGGALKTWWEESRTYGHRVVKGECSQTLPSGFPTAFPEWIWQECPRKWVFWESCCWMLVCPCWQLSIVGTVAALARTLASRLLFRKSHMRRSAPCPPKRVDFFLFFIWLFIYYLRGLGFLALGTSPLFKSALKGAAILGKVFPKEKNIYQGFVFTLYWIDLALQEKLLRYSVNKD